MPDTFPESPFYDHPDIIGAAQLTGHKRYEEWFRETDHPNYEARVASYHDMTIHLQGQGSGREAGRKGPPRASTGLHEPSQLPSWGVQVGRFAKAVGRQVAARVKGEATKVSPELQAARLEVCRAPCVHYRDERCTHKGCGCRLSGVLNKSAMATERCPIGAWPALTEAHPAPNTNHPVPPPPP